MRPTVTVFIVRAFCVLAAISWLGASAQTLFVPAGTSGIGTSASGSVGVGTTNPLATLQVKAALYKEVQIGDTAGAFSTSTHYTDLSTLGSVINLSRPSDGAFAYSIFSYRSTWGGHNLGITARSDIKFVVGAVPDRGLIIKDSGNIGIGTTIPSEKLEVNGGGSDVFIRVASTGGDKGIVIQRDNVGSEYLRISGVAGGNLGQNNLFLFDRIAPNGQQLRPLRFRRSIDAGVTYNNDLTLDQDGNVGIGTTNPVYHLQVESSVDKQLQVVGKGTGFGGSLLVDIYSERTSAAPGSDRLFRVGSAYAPDIFGVFGSGNVGIGTTAPTHKLAVNGAVRAKEVIVDTGWSDYVFAPDYRLAPLSEVEAHIKAKQHLPGIPSAAEVAEQGVSVGDMQAKLLAKIEELTLHQIEQAKRLAALEAECAALRTQKP